MEKRSKGRSNNGRRRKGEGIMEKDLKWEGIMEKEEEAIKCKWIERKEGEK